MFPVITVTIELALVERFREAREARARVREDDERGHRIAHAAELEAAHWLALHVANVADDVDAQNRAERLVVELQEELREAQRGTAAALEAEAKVDAIVNRRGSGE